MKSIIQLHQKYMKQKHKKTLDNVEVGKSIEINGYDYQYVGKKVGKSGEIIVVLPKCYQ